MSYIVSPFSLKKINLAPATELEDILQNVAVIISTPKGSIPLDRDFGVSQRYVDKPMPTARVMFLADATDAVARYEPRAEVRNVKFETDTISPGKFIPHVEVDFR
jgi:phage baseplate assembly protein W